MENIDKSLPMSMWPKMEPVKPSGMAHITAMGQLYEENTQANTTKINDNPITIPIFMSAMVSA